MYAVYVTPIAMEIHPCEILDARPWQPRICNSKYREYMKVIEYLFELQQKY